MCIRDSPDTAKSMKEQPMAANIDYAFLVMLLNDNFSVNRAVRYKIFRRKPRGCLLYTSQQKQSAIKEAFAAWIWKDPQRRMALEKEYNERFNSLRPAEFSGEHINFCLLYTSMPEALQKSHLQENSVVILELVAEKQFNWFKMKWRRKH